MTSTSTEPSTRPLRAHLARGLAESLKDPSQGSNHDSASELGDALISDALREQATDIHFEPHSDGFMVRLRIDGQLLDALMLRASEGARLVRHFKAVSGLDSSQHFVPANTRVNLAVDGQSLNLRLASIPCIGGEAVTIRLLDRVKIEQRLGDLGLARRQHKQIERWLQGAFGMFLVAGPTGSGKTTTLYALLHELRSHDRAIFTIEDPVEYEISGVTQTQVDRHHGLTFATGLRAIQRLDPDYLFLGEIRDPDAAHAAAEASASGRVLMSSIHSPDAVGAVTALRNMEMSDREIAASLQVVIAQRLVRRLCPQCRRPANTGADEPFTVTSARRWEPVGCDACRQLGYSGRVGLFEVWKLSDADRAAIAGPPILLLFREAPLLPWRCLH